MKLLTLSWAFSLLSFGCLAQTIDSLAIDVVYHTEPRNRNVLLIVDGTPVASISALPMDPNMIEGVDVSKTDTLVGGHTYDGVISIKLKDGYAPKLISLAALKQKYIALQPGPTVFMIDNQLINGSHDRLMIDEKYILMIEVNRLTDAEGREDVNVVKLLTRSEENIRKSKEFRIRGNASAIEPTGEYTVDFRSIDRQLEGL